MQLLAAGNHTVVRTQHGMQEGVADEQRNKQPKEVKAKAKAKAKQANLGRHVSEWVRKLRKPNWKLFDFNCSIPPQSKATQDLMCFICDRP